MKLAVSTDNARRLGNGLVAHVRRVQDYIKKHGKPPQKPYLTYTDLVAATGANLALVGIGNFLEEIMVAIHAPGVPEALRGLTLFVTDKTGRIDYDGNMAGWRGINSTTSMQFRKAVLVHDWSDVEFVVSGE